MGRDTFSINGVGWKFYGQRDFGPDGSFITTEWFIVFHIPIFPLRSYRAISHGSESVVGPFYQRQRYSLSRPISPDLKQVFYTYIYVLALAGITAAVITRFTDLTRIMSQPGLIVAIVVCGLLFLLLPGLLRGWAMRRAGLKVVRRRRRR
jgi:hypothetical protein